MVLVRVNNRNKAAKVKTKPVIVVGRAVYKKAVVRNKIKRRIRAIIKPFSDQKGLSVLVRPGDATKTFKELKAELLAKLQKN